MDKKLNPRKNRKWARVIVLAALIFCYGFGHHYFGLFRSAPRFRLDANVGGSGYSQGLAPVPSKHPEAVIQVYSARVWGAKGALAVHSWIATKRTHADSYIVSQIVGWAVSSDGDVLFSQPGIPDKGWYGNPPNLLLDIRGERAEKLIKQIDKAIVAYPWSATYSLWPGPNSNTFISWIGLEVPELGLDLPATAIGKDWRPVEQTLYRSASGSGIQLSIFGMLGASIGYQEGIELNLLGLNFEIDLFDLAVELPFYGRIGDY